MALGARVRSVRKRRGLSQRELASLSGVSLGLIRKLEQGERDDTRLETLRKLAVALRVPTSTLTVRPDADQADSATVDRWRQVREALMGQERGEQPDEAATAHGVNEALADATAALAVNRYAELAVMLPALIRDAEALHNGERAVRARLLNVVGWLCVQTRQFDTAEMALCRAADAATDRLDEAAVANTRVWLELRQGKLERARSLAIRTADDIEPRLSRATTAELSLWGRLMLGITNAAVRDNRPGEAEDALRLARAAAVRIGHETMSDSSTARTFGPVTVAHVKAETAMILEQPDKVIAIAQTIPATVLHQESASRNRHLLDVAHARVLLRDYGQAYDILERIRQSSPQWLVQQRYARDILQKIVNKRRTLTQEMRELADFISLEL